MESKYNTIQYETVLNERSAEANCCHGEMKCIWYLHPHMKVKYLAPNLSGIIQRAVSHSNISVIFYNYFITQINSVT